MKSFINIFIFFLILLFFISCSSLLKSLGESIYQQRDIELVKEGAPSYLLLVEGLIKAYPKNREYLKLGIQLFTAYSSAFITEAERKELFTLKAKEWGLELLKTYPNIKKVINSDFETFEKEAKKFKKKDIDYIFWAANAWIIWIISHTDSLEALLDLPKARCIVDKVYDLDDSYYYGAPHLFYGIYYSFLPESYGGDLKKAEQEFNLALKYAQDKLLLTKISYATVFLRAKNDRESFIKILKEVINTDIEKYPEQRLLNIIAQKQAKELLKKVDEFFY